MAMAKNCLYCCAPYTLIAAILNLSLFGMLASRSWTFEVIAAKNSWDMDAKARCCLNAAIIYLVVSGVLWGLVLFDSCVMDLSACAARMGLRKRSSLLIPLVGSPTPPSSKTPVAVGEPGTFPTRDAGISPLATIAIAPPAADDAATQLSVQIGRGTRAPSQSKGSCASPTSVLVSVRSDSESHEGTLTT